MEFNYRFSKAESLRHKKLFDLLFSEGERSLKHPLLAIWKEVQLTEHVPLQVGFSVPKKHFKKAVTRNLIKRRLREAYRLQKHELTTHLQAEGKQMVILFIVLRTDNISYEHLRLKILLLLQEIAQKLKHAG